MIASKKEVEKKEKGPSPTSINSFYSFKNI
jgi:hypothetical protein